MASVGGVATAMATADAPYPRPGADPATVRTYFLGNAGPARVSVAGQLLSSAALVPFTAAVARLAARSGPRSRARVAAVVGGGALAALRPPEQLGIDLMSARILPS